MARRTAPEPPQAPWRVTRRELLKVGGVATAGLLVGCPDAPPTARTFGDCCQQPADAGVDAGSLDGSDEDRRRAEDAAAQDGNADGAQEDARIDAGSAVDPPPPVVLLQLSDVHIGAQPYALSAFTVALGGILPTLQPALTLITGDLVDDGEQDSQWQAYRDALDAAGVVATGVLEVPGNHDAKGDADLVRYLAQSLTGQACGGAFGLRDLVVNGRRIRLIAVNTAAGGSWARNLTGYLPTEQVDAVLADLALAPVADHTLIVGHHPLEGATGLAILNTDVELRRLIAATDAEAYLFGHTHQPRMSWDGRCLAGQASTLGNPTLINNAPGFGLLSLDDGVNLRHVPLLKNGDVAEADWPLVLITRPAHAELGGFNPRARTLPRGASQQLLRALVVSPQVPDEVSWQIDGGSWSAMARLGDHYQARFDCPDAAGCTVTVRVRAVGHTRQDSVRIRLA
ncbi:MAG: metallophosphoesterase [Pseudomonadota bacterium]